MGMPFHSAAHLRDVAASICERGTVSGGEEDSEPDGTGYHVCEHFALVFTAVRIARHTGSEEGARRGEWRDVGRCRRDEIDLSVWPRASQRGFETAPHASIAIELSCMGLGGFRQTSVHHIATNQVDAARLSTVLSDDCKGGCCARANGVGDADTEGPTGG